MLRGIRQFQNPNVVANSNFLPEYEIENCVFCKKCTTLCPMNAIELADEDTEDKHIVIDYDRCIGCGVCAFNCPNEALTMVKKFTKIPAANFNEAAAKYMEGRAR